MNNKEFKEMMYRKPHEMPQRGNPVPSTGNLRDQFAMSAMQGDFAAQSNDVGIYGHHLTDEQLADMSKFYYRMADAMLKARDK
ncbi:hypothetical protein QU814_05390 [Providencia rettgeri]|uniref:hypothetical protein n=1 Tax=Providencia rettgeri TaxID=587 RepID=UPI00222E86AD|nr:hypothetical protein [Providencia rettgeri]MDM9282623.1 hypothetical protein [Providencia rettgeri]